LTGFILSPGMLAGILARAGEMPATAAFDGERIRPGRIYVAPPDHHLVIEPGVVLQLKEDDRIIRFRCHTGHAYSLESLVAEIDEAIEESLRSALRSVEEKILLMNHIAEHVRAADSGSVTEQFLRAAQVAQRRADLVRQAVIQADISPATSADAKQ